MEAKGDRREEKTIILENGRCAWGQCIFCSMSKKKDTPKLSEEELKQKFDRQFTPAKRIKIFNSGSFVDNNQIPPSVREHIIKRCIESGVKELVIEVWPKLVVESKMKEIKEIIEKYKDKGELKIIIAMGLESAHDNILKRIKKGISVKDYIEATKVIRRMGFGIRTYLMVNLPYVKDVKKDIEESIEFAKKYSDEIVVMNTFAYSGYAMLFDMWVSNKWKPIPEEEFKRVIGKYKDEVEIYAKDYVMYPHFTEEHKKKAKDELKGAKEENLIHPYYEIWQQYISEFYEKPPIKEYALFLPCSHKKPYSRSRTHKAIISRLIKLKNYAKIHQIMISNPGVIPREFENKYPFNAYDWPEWEETEEIKKKYIEVTKQRVIKYLRKHHYKKIFAYFKPESESLKALREGTKELGKEVIYLLDEKIWEKIKGEKYALINPLLLEEMINRLEKEI